MTGTPILGEGLIVARALPTDAGPAALLAEARAFQASIYPPEHNHSLPAAALLSPGIRFFAARDGDVVLGIGALAVRADHGEVKSMYTAAAGRGRGVAAAILAAIEAQARAEGLPALRLETGEELAAACRLYERHGFRRRGAFSPYVEDGSSVFMEKSLA